MNHQKETPPGKVALNDWPDNKNSEDAIPAKVNIGGVQ
jgi:hypothetical protein